DLVARPQLLARLQRACQLPLTVVVAPAGFGKTTLLSAFLSAVSSPKTVARGRALQVAWLALDARDNDLALFVQYLVAALQTLAPRVVRSTLGLRQSSPLPNLTVLLPPLLNELAELGQECLLVLDDYHLLSNQLIHQALSFVLDHQPPPLHLLLASREELPLP